MATEIITIKQNLSIQDSHQALKCGECGRAYTGAGKIKGRSKQYDSYGCTSRKSKKTDCINPKIRKTVLEHIVFKAIKDEIFCPERLDIFIQELTNKIADQNKNIADLSKKNDETIQNIKNKKDKLPSLFLDSHINEEDFKKKNDDLELQLIEKIREQENLSRGNNIDVSKIKVYIKKLVDCLENKNISIKKQILQTFVEEILVFKDKITIRLKFFGLVDGGNDGGSGGN